MKKGNSILTAILILLLIGFIKGLIKDNREDALESQKAPSELNKEVTSESISWQKWEMNNLSVDLPMQPEEEQTLKNLDLPHDLRSKVDEIKGYSAYSDDGSLIFSYGRTIFKFEPDPIEEEVRRSIELAADLVNSNEEIEILTSVKSDRFAWIEAAIMVGEDVVQINGMAFYDEPNNSLEKLMIIDLDKEQNFQTTNKIRQSVLFTGMRISELLAAEKKDKNEKRKMAQPISQEGFLTVCETIFENRYCDDCQAITLNSWNLHAINVEKADFLEGNFISKDFKSLIVSIPGEAGVSAGTAFRMNVLFKFSLDGSQYLPLYAWQGSNVDTIIDVNSDEIDEWIVYHGGFWQGTIWENFQLSYYDQETFTVSDTSFFKAEGYTLNTVLSIANIKRKQVVGDTINQTGRALRIFENAGSINLDLEITNTVWQGSETPDIRTERRVVNLSKMLNH